MAFAFEQSLGFLGLGLATGAYGTLIGAGGGFVLMPLLLLLYPNESPDLLTSISLAVVFFNALSGSEAYAVMGRVDYKSGFLFALASVPGAVVGALSTSYVPRRSFDLIFGVLLAAGSILLLARPRARQAKTGPGGGLRLARHLVDRDGQSFDYAFNPAIGLALSLFVGYASSFLGIGGGIIHVPALIFLLNFPVHVATATSHFILAIMALSGTMVHILTGTFSHGVHRTIYLALGALIGAQVGARLSNHVKGVWIIRSLSLALGLVGVRIIVAAFQGGG